MRLWIEIGIAMLASLSLMLYLHISVGIQHVPSIICLVLGWGVGNLITTLSRLFFGERK